MERYFSLHGITDDLMKLCLGVLYLYPKHGNIGGNGIITPTRVILLGKKLSYTSMNILKQTLNIWAT
jgi:hypothetical protein